jgi:hypothetical protein
MGMMEIILMMANPIIFVSLGYKRFFVMGMMGISKNKKGIRKNDDIVGCFIRRL